MAWRFEVHKRRVLRRLKVRLARWETRWPALRRRSPIVLSVLLNGAFALAIFSFNPPQTVRGAPEAEFNAIDIYIVPPEPEAGAPPITDPDPDEDAAVPEPEIEATEVEEAEVATVEEETPPAPLPPAPEARSPSSVDVPEIDRARGTPDGIVALDCNAWFDDPVRARECAGTRVTSDWQSSYQFSPNEDWARSAEILRQGRYRSPFAVGPDRYGNLGENEQLYQREDPRFRVGPGPTSGGGGANFAAAFESREEYERFLRLYDDRLYVGDGGSRPLTGWRPSWQLRDDPDIDPARMREFLDSLEDGPGAE